MAKVYPALRLIVFHLGLLLALLFPNGSAFATGVKLEIPPAYKLVSENENFQLYVDGTTLAFKLVDKRNGYLWHSGVDELAQGDRLNRAWRAFALSGISIEYLDEKAVNKRASITNSNHVLDVTSIAQGISAKLTFLDYGITLGVLLQLETDGLRVEVPIDSIREENAAFHLGVLYVYPFLGATRGGNEPGYFLLPDGTGSLLRFADSTKAKNMYYGRYYGADLGMLAQQPYDPRVNRPYPISMPVFGIAHEHGPNALLAVVERGAAYGEIQAHPAGVITNFNFIYNAFIYNESYFQATNRSGAGVTTLQKQTNNFDVVLHYRFLNDQAADYVGMAQSYQQYLIDHGAIPKTLEENNPSIGLRLEFLGGDKEKVLFWHRFVPMTTVAQMSNILEQLQIKNVDVTYYGWQPWGASSMPPTTLQLDSNLGTLDELNSLSQKIATGGGWFSLYLNPQAALFGENGYSPRNDLAMSITNLNLVGYNRTYNYHFTYQALQQRLTALTQDLATKNQIGLALDGLGSLLYSDFRVSAPLSREAVREAYQTLLMDIPVQLQFYSPNDYVLGSTRAYYDMPLGDNGYIYTSEAVPFIPIVLAGHLPYYGEALNFSSNQRADQLRHADFGIYPSYFLTHEATAKMLSTNSSWIYTSAYSQWGNSIQPTYQWLNNLLAPVQGQEIVARQALAKEIYTTTYSNGSQIVVNYSKQPFTYSGTTIQAQDAALLEKTP